MSALARPSIALAAALVAAGLAVPAAAADWSDTSIGLRYGTAFAEPFNAKDITKRIVNLNHVSGYKYGSNFFNADLLTANPEDPAGANSTNGSQEIYVVYRHTLDLGKVTGSSYQFGPVRGVGFTAGFDYNTKTDAGYNSKKRMLVAGPTLMLDVPGFFNLSLLQLWESNAPFNTFSGVSTPRYSYDPHPMLSGAWGIPLGAGFSFEGFFNWIAAKGVNEAGRGTSAETNIDAQVMYDVSPLIGAKDKTFKVGIEYQYWRNKFGNNHIGSGVIAGTTAKTPMLRAEYHF